MPKASPEQVIFEGELSPLAQQRTDLERYNRGMRYMRNGVAARTGAFIGRSGTYYEQRATSHDEDAVSALVPFIFNEDETLQIEVANGRLRFHYEYQGIAAHRECAATHIVSTNPVTIRFPGHTWSVGEVVVFSGFAANRCINNMLGFITALSGTNNQDVTFFGDVFINGSAGALSGDEEAAAVYEVASPWVGRDVHNIRYVQNLNTMYLFCAKVDGGEYQPYTLKRYDTFDWRLSPWVLEDGPFLDIHTGTTVLYPSSKGVWIPDMTGPTTPSGQARSSSEAGSKPAWKAFDGDIDSYWEAKQSQRASLIYDFVTVSTNILPAFGGPTSGGMTISASSAGGDSPAWRVGDRNQQTDWRSANNSGGFVPQWLRFDLGAAQTVRTYRLRCSRDKDEFAPTDWTLQGSNDQVAWTVVDTRSGVPWTSGEDKQRDVQSPGSFRYYQFVFTKVQRKTITTVIPAQGKKGKKNYKKKKTVTTKTDPRVALSEVKLSVNVGTPRVVDGYTIYLGRYNKGKKTIDHAPKTWYFLGSHDGSNWDILDSQQNYKNWDDYRSAYFPLNNRQAYSSYAIEIHEVMENGDVPPRIGKLVMSSPDAPPITLTASSKEGINDGRGFLPTDVGRQIRLMDADNRWRWARIAEVYSETSIGMSVVSADPFVLGAQVKFWRLGLWSDTTGWPTCGVIHEDRLWCSGMNGFPDHVVGSQVGQHTNFQQARGDDIVLDTDAIVARCNSKHMSRVMWLRSSEEALMIGTGMQEFILTTPVDEALTARNTKIRPTTNRGSASHEPAVVGSHVLMISKSGRALYDYAWQPGNEAIAGAYSNVLVSVLGPHLLYPPLKQLVFQEEPHSVVWGLREDGVVVAMTYNQENGIFGGHRHDFGENAEVEYLSVSPSPTDRQDSLWMVIRRTVDGVKYRYIERLARFWDFGDLLNEDACFVDSALRYLGDGETSTVYGLRHLEGEYVHVLADNIVYRNRGPILNGALVLDRPAEWVVVGKQMVREGEIIQPNSGSEDGTARGKSKRPHSAVMALWETAKGEVGRWNEDLAQVEYVPIEYRSDPNPLTEVQSLKTEETKATVLPPGYGTLGTVRFRQEDPLPFNVTGVYPQLVTSDDR